MMLNRALSNAYLFPLAESKLLSHDMMSENRRLFINQIFLQRLWHANFRVWIIINVREREHGIFILTSCNRNCADSRKTFPRSFGNANVVSIEVTESTRLKRRITHTAKTIGDVIYRAGNGKTSRVKASSMQIYRSASCRLSRENIKWVSSGAFFPTQTT